LSDQYAFVKQGIAAVMPSPGFKCSDPKIARFEILGKREETRYHQPRDDMEQPGLDFDAATKYARFGFSVRFPDCGRDAASHLEEGRFLG
jgi:hypothetical protein